MGFGCLCSWESRRSDSMARKSGNIANSGRVSGSRKPRFDLIAGLIVDGQKKRHNSLL